MSGSKKWKPAGSTASRSGRRRRLGARIDAGGEDRAVRGEQRLLVAVRAHVLGLHAGRVDREEHVRVGAEVLEHRDLRVELRQRRIGERGVLEALGPDPEDDVAARRGPVRRERDPVAAERDRGRRRACASTRFIAGEPMKAATKRFSGRGRAPAACRPAGSGRRA